MKILVTGAAGFIGYHTVKALCSKEYDVVGLDCINDYYDISLKYGRLLQCGITADSVSSAAGMPKGQLIKSSTLDNYRFIRLFLEDDKALSSLFRAEQFDLVCHLAAQAGVRYSLENPRAYLDSNILGFFNILEACRTFPVRHLVYASSSSVYGLNRKMPFSVSHNVDHPVSLYAASKKSNELMAHTYSHLFGLPVTGLRFFTVYGPWGRPDMAYFSFTKAILSGQRIDVYNHGKMMRDFTYIDDIVQGVVLSLENPPAGATNQRGKSREAENLACDGRSGGLPGAIPNAIPGASLGTIPGAGRGAADYLSTETSDPSLKSQAGSLWDPENPDPVLKPKAGNTWDPENPDPAFSPAPYRLYNIGRGSPVNLMDFIREIEKALGREAEKRFLPLQPGDVEATWADITGLKQDLGYSPKTDLATGVKHFVDWYREYYNCK